MAKNKKKKTTQMELLEGIRKPLPPAGRVHTTKSGKRGYDRKEGKRIERDGE